MPAATRPSRDSTHDSTHDTTHDTTRRESLAWLLVISVVALLEGWLTRAQLNPDGVSYFDLADALRRGEWASFVQGYWSPLYPVLLVPFRVVAAASGADTLAAAHFANSFIAIVGALLTHRLIAGVWTSLPNRTWAPRALWIRAVWATYATCMLVLTRIDSITPDGLLLCVMIASVTELLMHGGTRGMRLGAMFGLAFLAKTSVWPWLLFTLVAIAAPWSLPAKRGALVRTSLSAILVMLAWVIPMSATYGHLTLGSTGALNHCWYLRKCDSRSPDTHTGAHRAYENVTLDATRTITVASFGDAAWTYSPWGDPTSWVEGVLTKHEEAWTVGGYVSLVLRNLWEEVRFVGRFLYLPIVLVVLLCLGRGKKRFTRNVGTDRAVTATLLGAMGLAQFVAVHVEPRLLAPFAFVHVVALVAFAIRAGTPPTSALANERTKEKRKGRSIETPRGSWADAVLASVPMLIVLPVLAYGVYGDALAGTSVASYRAEIASITAQASRGFARRTIVVVGDAFPLIAHAKALGARVVAQVLPASADLLASLPPAERQRVLREAGKGQADVAWQMREDGRVQITPLN